MYNYIITRNSAQLLYNYPIMKLDSLDEFICLIYDYDKIIELIHNLYDNSIHVDYYVEYRSAYIWIEKNINPTGDGVLEIHLGGKYEEILFLHKRDLNVLSIYNNKIRRHDILLTKEMYILYIKQRVSNIIEELQDELTYMNQFLPQPKRVN